MTVEQNRVEYLIAGDSQSYESLHTAQRSGTIEGVKITYLCPYCDAKNTVVHSTPVPSGCIHTCDDCDKQNTLTPADGEREQYYAEHFTDVIDHLDLRRRVKRLPAKDPNMSRKWSMFRYTTTPAALAVPILVGLLGATIASTITPLTIAGLSIVLFPIGLFLLPLLLAPISLATMFGIATGAATAAIIGGIAYLSYTNLASADPHVEPKDVNDNRDMLLYGFLATERSHDHTKRSAEDDELIETDDEQTAIDTARESEEEELLETEVR